MPTVIRQAKYIKSDVENNNNKFWYIVEYDNATCEVHFGRVGGEGAKKLHPFPAQIKATKFFDSKCREKEGERKGYHKLQTVDATSDKIIIPQTSLKEIARSQINTKSNETAKLVEYLSERNIHNILEATTLKYNSSTGLFSTPCGIVNKKGVEDARKLLNNINGYVDNKDFLNPLYAKILNEYLMLIPQKVGRKLSPETLYTSTYDVRKQNDILDSLDASLLNINSQTIDPNAKVERVFNIKLELCQDSAVFDRINKKYLATVQEKHISSKLNLKKVYDLEIEDVRRNYEETGKKLGNIQEYWHGTKSANLLSIFKGGLIIPPFNPGHCTGRLFGNGVYFCDISTKSLNYAHGYWDKQYENRCFMFLADVAMGKTYIAKPEDKWGEDFPKNGSDSTLAIGGESGVIHNEMIVYKLNQFNLKYLCEFNV